MRKQSNQSREWTLYKVTGLDFFLLKVAHVKNEGILQIKKKLKRHNDQMQYINFNKIPNWEEAADYKRHFGDKDKI